MVGLGDEKRKVLSRSEREIMSGRGLLTQVTTANATVVTGAKNLMKEIVKDGWYSGTGMKEGG